MNNKIKKFIFLTLALLAIIIFILLIIYIALVKEDYVKYPLLIGGYFSIILFAFGFLNYLRIVRKGKHE